MNTALSILLSNVTGADQGPAAKRPGVRALALLFVAGLGALGGCASAPASQSAGVVRSEPAQGAIVREPLRSVRLWFDELPADAATIELIDASGTITAVHGVHSMGQQDLMGILKDDLPDGDYRMRWRAGDAAGEVAFQLELPAERHIDRWDPPLDIGVVLYDGAEPLDVFGPLEMWMNLGPDNARVHLISEGQRPVVLTTTSYPKALAPRLEAQYSFENAPPLDVLMVPGGIGTLVEVDNPALIDFLRRTVPKVAVATSVCTGSALYAKAGLLTDVRATGNKVFFDYLVSQGQADWQLEARWVESGRFVTSSGVSAGIDMSLAVIARFFGVDIARMVAQSTEYEWNEDPERDPFVKFANTATPYVDQLRARFEAD
ncbi:MAG: DJ-1/PfpI family protein [Pseudomonadota bacterium]